MFSKERKELEVTLIESLDEGAGSVFCGGHRRCSDTGAPICPRSFAVSKGYCVPACSKLER